MSDKKDILAHLEKFKNKVVSEAKSNVSTHNDTGKLANSIKGNVKVSKNSIEIVFSMNAYGFFRDKGVQGTNSGTSLEGYKFGTNSSLVGKEKGGMSGIMSRWAKRKGLQWRDKETGRFMSHKSMGYLIAKSIYSKGIRPSLFFTTPFEKYYKKLPDELVTKYGLEVDKLLKKVLDDNIKDIKDN